MLPLLIFPSDPPLAFADPEEQDAIVGIFLKRLRADSRYTDANIVTIIERQMGYMSSASFTRKFNEFQPVIHMSLDPDGLNRPGVPSQQKEKLRYMKCLAYRLEAQTIRFEENLFGVDVPSDLRKLSKQAFSYVIEEKAPANPGFGEAKIGVSGKRFGPDDLIMGVQLLCYYLVESMRTDFPQPELRRKYNIFPVHWQGIEVPRVS